MTWATFNVLECFHALPISSLLWGPAGWFSCGSVQMREEPIRICPFILRHLVIWSSVKRTEAQEHSDMCLRKKSTYLSSYLPAIKIKGGKFKKRKEKEKGSKQKRERERKNWNWSTILQSKVNKDWKNVQENRITYSHLSNLDKWILL